MERREVPRYACRGTVAALLPADQPEGAHAALRGSVVNLSSSGACVAVDRPTELPKVLPLRFGFPGVPVLIPVLVEIRWTDSAATDRRGCRIGLRFIA
jgi:hypothetical protein